MHAHIRITQPDATVSTQNSEARVHTSERACAMATSQRAFLLSHATFLKEKSQSVLYSVLTVGKAWNKCCLLTLTVRNYILTLTKSCAPRYRR